MALAVPPGHYPVDTNHSQLGFAVTQLGLSTIRGWFDRYRGALMMGESLDDTSVTFEADVASLNSGNRRRDEQVLGADWLDLPSHALVSFRSTAATAAGDADHYCLEGELTVRSTTQPVALSVRYNGSRLSPLDGCVHHGFAATGTISRSAFGISFAVPVVSDEVQLLLDLQFVAPKP